MVKSQYILMKLIKSQEDLTLTYNSYALTMKAPNKQDLSQGEDSSPDGALPI